MRAKCDIKRDQTFKSVVEILLQNLNEKAAIVKNMERAKDEKDRSSLQNMPEDLEIQFTVHLAKFRHYRANSN